MGRLLCVAEWLPESGWPAVDDDALLAALPLWLLPSLSGVRDARVNLVEALLLLRYQQGEPPVLAVRMQEMFGEQQTPRVAVVLELLSPAHRPLQITRDLAAFWRGAYREVQKKMKGRYPKYPWPDDPAQALPTRRTRKPQ